MKTFVLFLFISVSAFSQTKKEMRTEIDLLKSQQAQVNLAHQIQVDQLIKKVDSLKTEIVRQNKQSQNDRDTIVYLQGELDNSNDSLTQLNKLLAKIQPKKKEEKTKVTTPRTSETDKPFVNPFGSGGSGNGSGMNYGTFGSGSGPGAGTGTGLRTRLNNVSINHIETEQDATIYLKLTIDANGNVISCISTSKTTTTNQSLITQVKNAVKSQVKYSKDPGSSPVQVFYTVKINGNN